MKKKNKVAVIVLGSLSLFFVLAFAAFTFTAPLMLGQPAESFNVNASLIGALLEALFIYPFDANKGALLSATFGGHNNALGISIANLVLLAIVFILFALGLTFGIVKKKKIMGFALPVLLIGGASAVLGFVQLPISLSAMLNFGKDMNLLFVSIAIFGSGVLGFVFALVSYIVAVCSANKKEASVFVAASPVEEAGNPEAVQEGEALAYSIPEVEEAPEIEAIQEAKVEPEKEATPEPEPSHVEVNVNNAPNGNGIDQNSLAALLREVVRDIVRDEIARNNVNQPQANNQPNAGNQAITGATFGGPLVVQYFNGGINGVNPYTPNQVQTEAAPQAKEEPAPAEEAPVEEAKEEVVAEEAPAPVVEAAPAPLFTKKEVPEGEPEAPKYERLTFAERLLQSEQDVQDLYNEIKNEILSYGVKSRISANGDTFRLHKKMYVRITVAGKSLKLYFALDPKDYADSKLPIQDASDKDMYTDIPLCFKVKSGLSVRRCKELIQDTMDKDGLEQGEILKVNWIKELKADLASGKKEEKDED